MTYLLLGAGLLALIYWGARPRRLGRFSRWRTASGGAAAIALAAAGFVAMRGEWPGALVLAVIGAWLALSARWPRAATPAPSSMSDRQARAILGVAEDATPEEIRAAHARLMRKAHPDVGGTSGLAAQLNVARDRLLRG
jgi:hypothetical protein